MERDMLHSWDVLRGREQLLAERHGMSAVEIHAAHPQVDEEHGIDVVTEPEGTHIVQAANEQTRPYEQYD